MQDLWYSLLKNGGALFGSNDVIAGIPVGHLSFLQAVWDNGAMNFSVHDPEYCSAKLLTPTEMLLFIQNDIYKFDLHDVR